MKTRTLLVLAVLGMFSALAPGETVKDREGAVREDRAKLEDSTRWIYNDVSRGFETARASGKPLMVVLRCIPCLACMGIDTEVLTENAELTPLMDQFVRVRVINANALDLSRFQFDYDLSFSTLFFNGDGTVYGRYGSWEHQRDAQNKATASFRRALEGALAIHRDYPANKASLAGKQGEPSVHKTPVDMPTIRGKYRADLDWEGKVVQSCVHCHQIGDAIRHSYRDQKEAVPEKWIYAFPAPEAIGIALSEDSVAKIEDVAGGSPASAAGLKAGDEIVSLAGQPLISSADFSWALHQAPDSGTLAAVVRRGDREASMSVELPVGWRARADISRRAGTWPMRAMAFGGMKLEELTDEERRKEDLAPGVLALRAQHVGQYGAHALAKKEGFAAGDVIVEVDGDTKRLTEGELIGHLLREYRPGQKVPATVLRKGSRMELKIPTQ